MSDVLILNEGRAAFRIRTHDFNVCAGEDCCIHNPSEHHMVEWPMNWRDDRGMMERMCPHGVGHPDPDDLAYKKRSGSDDIGLHGCCGCCNSPG